MLFVAAAVAAVLAVWLTGPGQRATVTGQPQTTAPAGSVAGRAPQPAGSGTAGSAPGATGGAGPQPSHRGATGPAPGATGTPSPRGTNGSARSHRTASPPPASRGQANPGHRRGAAPKGQGTTGASGTGGGATGSGSTSGRRGTAGHRRGSRGRTRTGQHTPRPAPGASRPAGGIVTVTPRLARNPLARPVAALLNRYFAAINHRNYREYLHLFGRWHQLALRRFRSGYRSTRDSHAVLLGVAPTRSGLVATVTFQSRQGPAASPDHAHCDQWMIKVYLRRAGRGYLISPPAAGYQARYHACPAGR